MPGIIVIIDKIHEILSQQYTSCTFYIHRLPDSIERPAFNIYLDTDRSEDAGYFSSSETVSVGVTYFSPADPVADELKQLNVYSNIRNIFRKGYIELGDRSIKISFVEPVIQDTEWQDALITESIPVDIYIDGELAANEELINGMLDIELILESGQHEIDVRNNFTNPGKVVVSV